MSNVIKASSNAYTKGGKTDDKTLIEADGTTSKDVTSYSDPIESAYGYVTFPEKRSREEQLEGAKGGRKARLEHRFAKQDIRSRKKDRSQTQKYEETTGKLEDKKQKQNLKLHEWETKKGLGHSMSIDETGKELGKIESKGITPMEGVSSTSPRKKLTDITGTPLDPSKVSDFENTMLGTMGRIAKSKMDSQK